MHVGALSRFASKLPGLDERRDHALRAPVDLGENAPFRLLTFKNGDNQRVALNFMKLPRIRLYFHVSSFLLSEMGLIGLIGPIGPIRLIGPIRPISLISPIHDTPMDYSILDLFLIAARASRSCVFRASVSRLS